MRSIDILIGDPFEVVTHDGATVTYGGEDVVWVTNDSRREAYLRAGGLRIEDAVDARSTAAFQVIYKDGINRIDAGDQILIRVDGTPVFGGVVEAVRLTEDTTGILWGDITAADWTALLDRHVVAGAYENDLAGDIVKNILTSSAVSTTNEESIATTLVADGPTVKSASFNYVTAAEAFAELAEFVGFTWGVTTDKVAFFRARDAVTAPFSITDASGNFRTIQAVSDKDEYRNRQYVRAGKDLTDARTESFIGDGTVRSWVTAFPIGVAPTIEVNSVTKTVGIQGLDTGKDFYWNKGSNVFSQDASGTLLTASDTIDITYQGLFPILVLVENIPSQGTRADVEGTSGIYTRVAQDASVNDRDIAIAKASSLLARYGEFQTIVTITTDTIIEGDTLDVRAGHLLTVDKPKLGLDASECLIDRVEWNLRSDGEFDVRLDVLTGTQTKSWLRYDGHANEVMAPLLDGPFRPAARTCGTRERERHCRRGCNVLLGFD